MIRVVITLKKIDSEPIKWMNETLVEWTSKYPVEWICDCPMFEIQKTGSTPRVAFMNTVNALKRIKKEQLEALL